MKSDKDVTKIKRVTFFSETQCRLVTCYRAECLDARRSRTAVGLLVVRRIFQGPTSSCDPSKPGHEHITYTGLRSYSTPGPVSTWMGDCLRAGKLSRYEASQLGQLGLLPSVGW